MSGWKPTTAAEALAYVEHAEVADHEPEPGCCSFWEIELSNAQRMVDALTDLGWLPPAPMRSEPKRLPRVENPSKISWGVLLILDSYSGFGFKPVSTEWLAELYEVRSSKLPALYPPCKRDTPRKRLAGLKAAGLVEQVGTDDRGFGCWKITRKGQEQIAREQMAA